MTTRATTPLNVPAMMPGELITDYRTRLAMEQSQMVERRRQELVEQGSDMHTPDKRIRLWEQLHALTLPMEKAHPLLKLIASETNLSVEDVTEEQQRRATAAAAKGEARAPRDPYCMLSPK